MSSYSRHGSYSEKVLAARKRRKTVGEIILVLLMLAFVRSFLLQSYRIDDNSMVPGLQKGDHVFSSPFLHGPDFFGMRLPALSKPYRGEMVLVRSSSDPHASGWSRFWDSILRFFSFQRYSPLDRAYGDGQTKPCIARVIAIPGDRVKKDGVTFIVRVSGQSRYIPEFSASRSHYAVAGGTVANSTDSLDSLWSPETEMTLGAGEYFLAFDNRETVSGSLIWGPVTEDRIKGRVFAVYWPLGRIQAK